MQSCGYNYVEFLNKGKLVFAPHSALSRQEIHAASVARMECVCVKRFVITDKPVDDLEVASISYRGALFLAFVVGSMIAKLTVVE